MLPQDLLTNPRTLMPSGTFSCSLILYKKASFFSTGKVIKGKMNFDVISSTCENAKNIIICRQKFHRVYVRETCFKRFLEFHETVSSNRTLLYFLKLVSYFFQTISQSQLGYF